MSDNHGRGPQFDDKEREEREERRAAVKQQSFSPLSNHVPSCQCAKCKPPLGPAMPAEGERFRVFVELSFEIGARDYFTAKQTADRIAEGVAQIMQAAQREEPIKATARVLSVERKEQ